MSINRVCGVCRSLRTLHWPLFAFTLLPFAGTASAQSVELPSGGVVVAGQAAIGAPGDNAITIAQSSAKAIIDWRGFSIREGGKVRFDNGSGATLNRVTGASASSIDGLLTASGSVYLLNPNGVIIGKTGVVDVGGSFVASTLDVSNADFLAGGDLAFLGASRAAVVNLGRIGALGGDVAMIAMSVRNDGAINAANGTAGLAAGTQVLVRDASLDDGRFTVQVGGAGTSATNAGAIGAAAVELRANGGNVYALAGNAGSGLRATGVSARDGRLFLTAGDGVVMAAGDIVARGAGGSGGFVETSAATVDFAGARIDAGAGGTWLLDPTDLTIDQGAANTISATLDTGTSVTQSTSAAGTGGNGDITVSQNVNLGWTTDAALVLAAYRNIAIGSGARIASSAGGKIVLYSDTSGSGIGTVGFGAGAILSTSGPIYIVYNPASNPAGSGVNATSYTNPANFAANVSGGGPLYAEMLVNSLADLQNIRNNLSGTYALGRDIDASATASGFNGGAGFAAIGTTATPFAGFLQGQRHTISSLTVGSSARDYVGLFGVVGTAGRVENVILTGASVTGRNYVGGVAGYSAGTLAHNDIAGAVSGAAYVGGVTGYNAGSALADTSAATVTASLNNGGGAIGSNHGVANNILATGGVSGGAYVGGVAGWNGGTMIGDVATGTVTATGNNVGGLVGGVGGGLVSNGLATGAVSGNTFVGGLVGAVTSGATVTASMAQGSVSGFGIHVGGLAGYSAGTITASEVRQGGAASVTGYGNVGGLVGYNAGSIDRATVVAGTGGVAGTSYVGGVVGYTSGDIANSASSAAVVGQGGNYLGGFAGYSTARLAQVSASGTVNATRGGSAVGGLVGYSTGTVINASAQGAVIGGNEQVGGLVGANTGTIVSVSATGPVDGGSSQVGGLAGGNFGSIDHATASGRVTTQGLDIGGLVGLNNGSITSSSASGAVEGYSFVGGLVGENGGYITNANASGAVAAANSAGGLVGYQTSSPSVSGYLDFVSASGDVRTTGDTAGGLVGRNGGDIYGRFGAVINHAFATGRVVGNGYVGGLVGSASGLVTQSYATGGVTSTGAIVGGLIGYADATIQDVYATGDVVGPDRVGGLIGQTSDSAGVSYPTNSVLRAYASGNVFGTSSVGGLFGASNLYNQASVFWDVGTTGQAAATGQSGTGAAANNPTAIGGSTGRDPFAQSTYAGFGFGTVWTIQPGMSRPYLSAIPQSRPPQ